MPIQRYIARGIRKTRLAVRKVKRRGLKVKPTRMGKKLRAKTPKAKGRALVVAGKRKTAYGRQTLARVKAVSASANIRRAVGKTKRAGKRAVSATRATGRRIAGSRVGRATAFYAKKASKARPRVTTRLKRRGRVAVGRARKAVGRRANRRYAIGAGVGVTAGAGGVYATRRKKKRRR